MVQTSFKQWIKVGVCCVESKVYNRISTGCGAGRLGGLIGAELWYPFWNKSQFNSAVNDVASKIGSSAKLDMT
jgi:hypothetical protein